MTAGAGLFLSLRLKLILLLGGPLVVVLATTLLSVAPRPSGPSELDRHELRLHETFESLLAEASRVGSAALHSSPRQAWDEVRSRGGVLSGRIEGVGVLDRDLFFDSWAGMPVEPYEGFDDPARSDWSVRVDGVRTRLVARAGPDENGRWGLVSLVIDSTLDDLGFLDLLPPDLREHVQIDVVFLDAEELDAGTGVRQPPQPVGAADERSMPLVSSGGEVLAVATLAPAPREAQARRLRQVGRAWAAVLLLLALAALVDWRALSAGWGGLLLVSATVVSGRMLLVWQNVTGLLLPHELGAPSLYGSSKLWGALESPVDLLLTAAVLYLLCKAARVRLVKDGGRWLAGLGAGAATWAVIGITASLAENSRIPLLDRPAPFQWDGRFVLWVALLVAILGAAELWALLSRLTRSDARPAAEGARAVPLALAVVVLSAGSTGLLRYESGRLALEQLSTEFAPQVLSQESLRRLALADTMNEIIDRCDDVDIRAALSSSRPDFLAYDYWVDSRLFFSRFKSSLDFYNPEGEPLSHFGFGLPRLDEPIGGPGETSDELTIREEWMDESAAQPRLLHAEARIRRGDEVVAVVVGHVLNEPDNLAFLPSSQSYLAALGPGVPPLGTEAFSGGLNYVLYDAFGAVTLTTLQQPPAETDALRLSARRRETIRVRAGDEPYVAVALLEDDERLHLLLLPAPTLAERVGAAVRLSLLGLSLLALLTLIARAWPPGKGQRVVPRLRGSFYRKLLAALLVASVLPLVGLALFLRGYLERRGDAALIASATQFVSTAQRVIEDYTADVVEGEVELNDEILHWLRRIVGQEIHIYRDGRLQGSSTPELFDSGLLPLRLDGEVQHRLVEEGLPYLVAPMSIGPGEVPVAYAPVREFGGEPSGRLVVAVPLVLEERQIARGMSRVAEMILLATVALVGLLAVVAALLARTVARPVRELVEATGQIAAGDYGTRLQARTEDEVAELVHGFNTMASALARQRADIERRRDYIEALLRHATIGVLSLDSRGCIVTLNPAAGELLASAAGRLEVGAELDRALAGSQEFEPLARALSSARSGVPVDVDLARDPEPRRFRSVRVELSRADGESFGTLILLEDVTEQMRSNQLAAWAEMARSIAHEIKNPLTPIQLSAEHLARLLGDRDEGATPDEQACLETIINQVRALYDIAGEFSAYAKLPVLTPEPTDPVNFMRGVIDPYRASKPPGVTIEERYEPAPAIAADAKVLSRAVINLIENALQAMTDGGTLTVGVAEVDQNGTVELSVADTGPGLSREVRRRLFEPYFSTKSSGSGLGLAIARKAVEAHGGKIEVASEPNEGSVFRIRIPVVKPS